MRLLIPPLVAVPPGKAPELLSRRMPPETVVASGIGVAGGQFQRAAAGHRQPAAAAEHTRELGIHGRRAGAGSHLDGLRRRRPD